MNRFFLHLLIVILVSSCDKETHEDINQASIVISSKSLNFDFEASTQEIDIETTGIWVVSSSAGWCKVSSPKIYPGKSTLKVTVDKNEGLTARTTPLEFFAVTNKEVVNVMQAFAIIEVEFSDDAFKNYCIRNLDSDGDGIFSTSEAATVETLDISGLGITFLNGIESFIGLKDFNCSNNNITEIPTRNLKSLTKLNCAENKLETLDIQHNTNIASLNCSGNSELAHIYVWYQFLPNTNFIKPEGAIYVKPEIPTPVGYSLVWQDEFNTSGTAIPNTNNWWYETGGHGWGNNEIQNYVSGIRGQDTCAVVYDGSLKIIAKKVGDEVLSIRMNTRESWTYGYFEARLKLPVGKGTWPAFWMMPKNFNAWPADGEIDIMEEVGANPNHISSSIHTTAYNHKNGTQKTAGKFVSTAESEFHVYAVEWTQDYIKGLVDGEVYFTFNNDHAGNKDTWPFDEAFYLKLNLAWGGDWGGYLGVDDSALPATYEIDYVRVFQKY